jgi:AcrR family transcriptional regulator
MEWFEVCGARYCDQLEPEQFMYSMLTRSQRISHENLRLRDKNYVERYEHWIAERAGVPKGLVHYYFKRKPDLLAALVERLPEDQIDPAKVVVPGDVAASLHRLVDALDRALDSSALLSHLLWREADTHPAVLDALQARFGRMVEQIRAVLNAARPRGCKAADVDSAAHLLASAVSYRHSVARHAEDGRQTMKRELRFLADALAAGAGA